MTEKEANPARAVAKRVRALRTGRGWSAERLAERCAAIGAPELNRSTISNIETGRRKYIDIGEVLALATAFGVPDLDLIPSLAPSADDVAAATGVDVETVRRVLTHVFRESR